MAKTQSPRVPPAGVLRRAIVPYTLLALTILLIFSARVRLLDVPLERDEGEYAYMGQLMLEGIPPYSIAANMKLPGVSAIYAIVMALFGQSEIAVHIGLLLINAATAWLIYLIGRHLFDPTAGLVSAAIFTVLSSSWSVLGVWAHATHFVILPVVAGTLLLLRWNDSRKLQLLVWSGTLFGISILMKQHGAVFAMFGVVYILTESRWKEGAVFGAAVAAPFALLCAILWRAGVMDKFWFWAFTYASSYATATPLGDGITTLFESLRLITLANWAVWLTAAVGFALVCRAKHFFLIGYLFAAFLAICPGFYFREHYFILLLPALALCGGAVTALGPKIWPVWLVAAVLLLTLFEERHFLFTSDPVTATRAVYGANPFPEAVEVSKYIRKHAVSGNTIAVLGSEPEIFFYTQLHSPTPYIYAYPLMESHPFARQMQSDFIRDVESAKPRFVVMVNVSTSWLRGPDSSTALFDWWDKYGIENYEQVGIADILPRGTAYLWDADASAYRPRSASHLLVFRRR
jgi:hypothetical protein